MIVGIVVVLLLAIIVALAVWCAFTAATAFTLAASNMVLQITVIVLALAIVVAGGALWRAREILTTQRDDRALASRAVSKGYQIHRTMLPAPRARHITRRVHAARAMRIAQRWFR